MSARRIVSRREWRAACPAKFNRSSKERRFNLALDHAKSLAASNADLMAKKDAESFAMKISAGRRRMTYREWLRCWLRYAP